MANAVEEGRDADDWETSPDICRNEHKQMRRNCYQQGRMEDHSIQRRVRQGTAVR